jgi:hypothetical protein
MICLVPYSLGQEYQRYFDFALKPHLLEVTLMFTTLIERQDWAADCTIAT